VPGVFVKIHFDENVARIHMRDETTFLRRAPPRRLPWDQDAANLILQIERSHAAFQAFFDFLSKPE